MLQINPMQFNIRKLWFKSWRELLEVGPISDALTEVHFRWDEIAEFKFEDASEYDEELARENFELDLHIGKVKVKDFDWLRETFENIDLIELALAIAEHAMPGKTWDVLENGEECVVTDTGRSVVFDFKHGDDVPAGTSLLIAGDTQYQPTESDSIAYQVWLNDRTLLNEWRVEKMQSFIESHDKPGVVLNFPVKT